MADARPILALDVEGVVVLDGEPLVPVREQWVNAWGRWRRHVSIPYDAPEIIRRLAERFEIVWASSWGHNAHTSLQEVLDLPERPWDFIPVQFQKGPAVAKYAAGRPWVLIEETMYDSPDPAKDQPAGAILLHVSPVRGIAEVDPDELIARVANGDRRAG